MANTEQERRPVTATLRIIIEGYAADLEASGTLEDLVGLAKRLHALGIEPANSPLLWECKHNGTGEATIEPPTCPVYGSPMKRSQYGDGWCCPRKVEDGGYCQSKVS